MKKYLYLALMCLSFIANSFAADIQDTEWDLDRTCQYTCSSTDKAITYRELLKLAQEEFPEDKNWDIVNKCVSNFALPVSKAVKLDFGYNEYSSFVEAEKYFNTLFFKKCTGGLSGCTRTQLGRVADQRGGFSGLVYDLDFALNILHVNSYNYTGGNT